MTHENITRERLTDCISILLDVDDATHREHGDLITRMITVLQDMRNSMPTESERIKAKFAELSAKMADEVYGKRANTAIEASSAPSPERGDAGARYVVREYQSINPITKQAVYVYRVWNAIDEIPALTKQSNPYYGLKADAQIECNRLNAQDDLNAAHPASGNADTVAGSGNGGGTE